MNRVITLQVEIINKDLSEWIWDSHLDNTPIFGVHIQAIKSGPIPADHSEDEFDE